MRRLAFLLSFVVGVACATPLATGRLAWDQPNDSRIESYHMHCGTAPATYTRDVVAPGGASAIEISLVDAVGALGEWWCAATSNCVACGESGEALQSGFSNEVYVLAEELYPATHPGVLQNAWATKTEGAVPEIEFVNSGGNQNNGGSSTIAASAFAATAGNSIVVLTSNYTSGGMAVTSITDTAGNSYSRAGSAGGGDANHTMEAWLAHDITGNAANVVTVNFAGSAAYRAVIALQYIGGLAFDAQSQFSLDAGSMVTHTTDTTPTTGANGVVVGLFVTWDDGYAFSSSSPSILRETAGDAAAVDRIVTSPGGYSVAVTTSSANRQAMASWAFKQ